MLTIAISLFLAIVPFMVWFKTDESIRFPKEIISIVGFAIITAFGLFWYKLRPLKNKWFFLFWVWCVVSVFINNIGIPYYIPILVEGKPMNFVVNNFNAMNLAWKELFYITLAFMTIFTVASVQIEPKKYKWEFIMIEDNLNVLFKMINYSLMVMCVFSLVQAIGFDQWFRVYSNITGWKGISSYDGHFTHRIVGTIGNPSLLSIWIAMCIPFALHVKSKIGAILGIATVCMTMSATAFVAMIVSILFYTLFKAPKIFIMLLVILLIAGSIGFVKQKDNLELYFNPQKRLDVHKEAWNFLKNRALTGMGFGTFLHIIGLNPETITKLDNQQWVELHDEYGEIWWCAGLIGLTLFLLFIFNLFMIPNTPNAITLKSSLLVFGIVSLTLFHMRISPHAFYGVIVTGLLLREKNMEDRI